MFELKTSNQRDLAFLESIKKITLFLCLTLLSSNAFAQTSSSNTVLLTEDGTWTVPCGVTTITVETWGAGGGGGRATEAESNGGGGGGGAYAKKTLTVSAGDSFSYQIGKGGSGGDDNKDGGDTWFSSSTLVMAKGGKGVANNNHTGGIGGQASESIGDTKFSGGKGGNVSNSNGGGGGGAARSNANGGNGSGSSGGSSTAPGGNGGSGSTIFGNGGNGNNYGGGGGGAKSVAGIDRFGGAGANGVIRITYTISPISAVTDIIHDASNLGCVDNNLNLQAVGGNINSGVSTLWYEGTNCPSFAYVNEFATQNFTVTNAGVGNYLSSGNRTFKSSSNDPMIHMENVLASSIDPSIYKYMVIRYRVVAGNAGETQIYFKKQGQILHEDRKVAKALISDGNWHIQTLDMSSNIYWNNAGGRITGWRYDFASAKDVEMEIDYIVLSSVKILENTNADDAQIDLQVNSFDTNYGVVRISDQATACENSVIYTACTSVNIKRKDRIFNGNIDNDWSKAGNWNANAIPTAESCVKIPNGKSVVLDTNSALAKNLTLEAGGKITINQNQALTVSDFVKNEAGEDNFILENGASLVQINDNAMNVGKITAKRTFTFSNDRKQYNFIISPVKGQKIKTIYNNPPFVIYHKESTNYFHNAYNGDYVAGRGFSIKEPSTNSVSTSTIDAVMKGEPFNGILNFPLSYSPSPATGVSPGYNFVGNPYPSTLDIVKLYAANPGKIESTIKFWDNRNNTLYSQQGSAYGGSNYAVFNIESGTHGTGVPAPTNKDLADKKIPTKYVPVGTAFMVKALPAGNGQTLDFKNEFRAVETGEEFFGKTNNFVQEDDRFWLTLQTPDNLEVMTAVVYFENGNNEFGVDDTQASGASDELYTIIGDNQAAIQGKAPFSVLDKLPLGMRFFELGTYTLTLYDKEGVFANGQNIYVFDKKLQKIHNLTASNYVFDSAEGEYNNRFEIIYTPMTFQQDDSVLYGKGIKIEKKDGNIEVTSKNEKITKVEIFNLNGRSSFQKSGINAMEFKTPLNQLERQIIVVLVETESGEVVSKKLVW